MIDFSTRETDLSLARHRAAPRGVTVARTHHRSIRNQVRNNRQDVGARSPQSPILRAMSRFLVLLSVMACATPAWAVTACPQHFALGVAPLLTNAQLQPRIRKLCFEAYAVLHSGVSRTPVYAAEHLTRSNLLEARTLSRKDAFHPEASLPVADRSELGDYARSGYDRGHMAPNGDMPTRKAQAQSFSLANMVPQLHANNAGVWAGIEMAVRELAVTEGELYVVSGPAFLGADIQQIGRGVLVPTHLWKVVYSPSQQRAGAYVITNDETRAYSAISLRDLERMVGVQALPTLPAQVQQAGMALPLPRAQGSRNAQRREARDDGAAGAKAAGEGGFTLQDLARSVDKALRRATH
jgi:endonuclease G